MTRLLGAVLLAMLAAQAQAAVVWSVTRPSDCTGLGAPTGCCVVANPGANAACAARNTAGTLTVIHTDLKSDGGTYTAGGDIITAKTIGLGSIVYAECGNNLNWNAVAWPQANGNLKLQLANAAGTELTGAVAAGSWLTCDFYGR